MNDFFWYDIDIYDHGSVLDKTQSAVSNLVIKTRKWDAIFWEWIWKSSRGSHTSLRCRPPLYLLIAILCKIADPLTPSLALIKESRFVGFSLCQGKWFLVLLWRNVSSIGIIRHKGPNESAAMPDILSRWCHFTHSFRERFAFFQFRDFAKLPRCSFRTQSLQISAFLGRGYSQVTANIERLERTQEQ